LYDARSFLELDAIIHNYATAGTDRPLAFFSNFTKAGRLVVLGLECPVRHPYSTLRDHRLVILLAIGHKVLMARDTGGANFREPTSGSDLSEERVQIHSRIRAVVSINSEF